MNVWLGYRFPHIVEVQERDMAAGLLVASVHDLATYRNGFPNVVLSLSRANRRSHRPKVERRRELQWLRWSSSRALPCLLEFTVVLRGRAARRKAEYKNEKL